MEFTIKRSELEKELQLIRSALERKHTIPILANVLIETTDQGVRVTGTDLEMAMRATVPAIVREPGGTTADGRKVYDIIRTVSGDQVEFKSQDGYLVITSGTARFRLATLAVEDFPEFPKVEGEALALGGSPLAIRIMAERTVFATIEDISRYALSGVQIELTPIDTEQHVRMVATDGHRLAFAEMETLPTGLREPRSILVPHRAIRELIRLTRDCNTGTYIRGDKDHVLFECGTRELVSRLLTDRFPNYEPFISEERPIVACVSRERFGEALRCVALVSDKHSPRVTLSFSDGQVELSASSEYPHEDAHERIPLVEWQGDPIDIAFNANYLLDFFRVVETDRVWISMKDSKNPASFAPEQPDVCYIVYQYIVMPMRLDVAAPQDNGNNGVE